MALHHLQPADNAAVFQPPGGSHLCAHTSSVVSMSITHTAAAAVRIRAAGRSERGRAPQPSICAARTVFLLSRHTIILHLFPLLPPNKPVFCPHEPQTSTSEAAFLPHESSITGGGGGGGAKGPRKHVTFKCCFQLFFVKFKRLRLFGSFSTESVQ